MTLELNPIVWLPFSFHYKTKTIYGWTTVTIKDVKDWQITHRISDRVLSNNHIKEFVQDGFETADDAKAAACVWIKLKTMEHIRNFVKEINGATLT